VAQVSFRMLKVLFPNDTVMLKEMADGQKRAKLLSGAASPTDIAAGEAIANAVAEKALARLRTDGMGQAVGNPNIWAALEAGAVAKGNNTPWKTTTQGPMSQFPTAPSGSRCLGCLWAGRKLKIRGQCDKLHVDPELRARFLSLSKQHNEKHADKISSKMKMRC
jgi:hypothetical protein